MRVRLPPRGWRASRGAHAPVHSGLDVAHDLGHTYRVTDP